MAITDLRAKAYANGVLSSYRPQTFTIGVGNLTFGGSGKTPVVDFLCRVFFFQKRVAVVSRGYKSRKTMHGKIDPRDLQSVDYGDEAFMLAQRNPQVDVHVTQMKAKMIRELDARAYDVIMVDDAFQHFQLKSHLNVLVIDASVPLQDFAIFPIGRGRESAKAALRADLVFFTKCNLAKKETLESFQKELNMLPQYCFEYVITPREGDNRLSWNQVRENQTQSGKKILALSGLAKPESFYSLLREQNLEISELSFPDHHAYTDKDLQKILAMTPEVAAFITTEKDWMKLQRVWPKNLGILVAQLELHPLFSIESLGAKLDSFFS